MFNSAGERFDARRHLVVAETNAIGTAYLRVDLLPAETQPEIRDRFRRYVDARIAVYRQPPEKYAPPTPDSPHVVLQNEIWKLAVAACSRSGVPPSTPSLLMPALNEMIDNTTTRHAATLIHAPGLIFVFLISFALCSALLAGYGMAGHASWLHIFAFAAAIAVSVYMIIDLEYPRLGVMQVVEFDQLLVDLRAGMG
jgi:hypothetical protein